MGQGNGKIATLPREIREQINWRINNDEPGIKIVEWLNSKPEVQAVMNEHYDGRPISEQNLSEWCNYGYQKWLALHIVLDEALAVSEDASELAETGINCEKLLLTLTASYAEMVQRWNIIPAEQLIYKMGIFKNLTNAILTLRRAEIQAVRLQFKRERLELLREKQRNKSASSSSARASSSAESAAKSEPSRSTAGAQSESAMPPMPPMPPILRIHAPPQAQPQSPATSPTTPAQHAATATLTLPPNTGSLMTGASVSEPPAPTLPAGAPSTSTPRNIRGLL